MEREEFICLVKDTIETHPDWWYDLIAAIQRGIISAIEKQRDDKAKLAYAMSGMLGCISRMSVSKRRRISQGMEVLADFFSTAAIEDDIRKLIPE